MTDILGVGASPSMTLGGIWLGAMEHECPVCSKPRAWDRSTYQRVRRDPLARAGKLEGVWTKLCAFEHYCSDDECAAQNGSYQHLSLWITPRYMTCEEEQKLEIAIVCSDIAERTCIATGIDSAWTDVIPSTWRVKVVDTPLGTVLKHTIYFCWPQNGNGRVEDLVTYLWDGLVALARCHENGTPNGATLEGTEK